MVDFILVLGLLCACDDLNVELWIVLQRRRHAMDGCKIDGSRDSNDGIK